MTRTTCSACGLQFEAAGRSARCPSCGARMRARVASGTLPPLPAGLQHHSAALAPVAEAREFHSVRFAMAMAFAVPGLFAAMAAVAEREPVMVVVAALLLAVFVTNGVATSGWYRVDHDGLRRFLTELPFYALLAAACFVTLVMAAVMAFAVLRQPYLVIVVIPAAILLISFGGPRLMDPLRELQFRMPTHPTSDQRPNEDSSRRP